MNARITIVMLQQPTHLLAGSANDNLIKLIDSGDADIDLIGDDEAYSGIIR